MDPSSNTNPEILAIIPAYNEERRVAEVVRAARTVLPVLVVDDGSMDDTARQARSAGATVLTQQPNQGKGAALLAGFEWALAHGYQAVVTLDADGQHDPAEIPSFLKAFDAHRADLIIGQRDFRGMPQPRRTSNTIGKWMFSWAVGQTIPDNQSGYRLLSRRMIEALRTPVEGGFEYEVEMIVRCIQLGYKLEWIPIRTIYGDEKSHIKHIPHIYNYFRVTFQARRALAASRRQRSSNE